MTRPSDKELSDLKWLLEKLTDSESMCQTYFDRAKRHYRLYRFGSAVDEADWPYVNRVRSRDILAFIEDSTAILVKTLFASMPFYSVIPRETRVLYANYEQIDPFAIGDQISRVLDYQITHEETEFFDEVIDTIKGAAIFGNGYTDVLPKFDSQGIYRLPLLRTRDFWDVLPISGARRISKARGIFIREFATLDDLKDTTFQGQPIYGNLDLLGKSSSGDPDKEWHTQLLQEVGMENYHPDDKNIEIIHYISGGHKITFANRKTILNNSNESQPPPRTMVEQDLGSPEQKAVQPLPYSVPTVQYKYMPVPLEFFGMGIPEVLEVLQEDKNLIRSARRDNIDLVIQKIIKVRAGADLNYDLLKFYPGAIWPLENLNDVEPWDQKDVTQSSYQEEAMRTQDMENALSLFGYARGMTPQHCVDDQTEILTDEGWKFFKDLNRKEKILTVNLKTKKYEWQKPTDYIVQDYEGWMIEGKNHNINFKVTPNHKMIVANQKGIYRLSEFSEIHAGDRIPRVYDWEGENPKEIDVIYKGKHEFINTKDWMAFIGIFIAEGHARKAKSGGYAIEIAQEDENKKSEIRNLLQRLPFEFKERGHGFYIYDKDLTLWLVNNIGKKEEKHIPKYIKELSSELLSELFKWMCLGDGNISKTKLRGKIYEKQHYTTYSKRLADEIQEIILKMGKNLSIHPRPARDVFDKKQGKTYHCKPQYELVLLSSKTVTGFQSKRHKFQNVWYKGFVYCVESPNKTVVTRRGQHTVITGNSEQPTTVIKLQQASLNRLDLNVKLAEFGYLQNLATRIVLCTRRFMPQSLYESIAGDQDAGFYRLTEEDIRRFYFFKPIGSSVANVAEVRQQQIQTAIQLASGIPPQLMQTNVTPFTIDYYELLKTAYDAVDIKNIDRILIRLQPQNPMMGGGMPGIPGGGPPNPGDMQALANVLYGQSGSKGGALGGALMEGIKAMLNPVAQTKGEER